MLQKDEAEGSLTSEMQKQRAQYFYNTWDLDKAAFYFEKAIEIEKSSYDQNQMINELLKIYLKQDRKDLVLVFFENEGSKLTRSEYISASFGWSDITITIDRHTIPVTLKQGENTILIKVCKAMQNWDMYMRFTDVDGNSFEDLKLNSADALLNALPH